VGQHRDAGLGGRGGVRGQREWHDDPDRGHNFRDHGERAEAGEAAEDGEVRDGLRAAAVRAGQGDPQPGVHAAGAGLAGQPHRLADAGHPGAALQGVAHLLQGAGPQEQGPARAAPRPGRAAGPPRLREVRARQEPGRRHAVHRRGRALRNARHQVGGRPVARRPPQVRPHSAGREEVPQPGGREPDQGTHFQGHRALQEVLRLRHHPRLQNRAERQLRSHVPHGGRLQLLRRQHRHRQHLHRQSPGRQLRNPNLPHPQLPPRTQHVVQPQAARHPELLPPLRRARDRLPQQQPLRQHAQIRRPRSARHPIQTRQLRNVLRLPFAHLLRLLHSRTRPLQNRAQRRVRPHGQIPDDQ